MTAIKEQIAGNDDLLVFPNPAQEKITIQLNNDWQGTLNLRTINTLCQVVQVEKLEKHNGDTDWELNLSKLSPGAYQIILSDGQQAMTKSIVKF